MQSEHVLQQPIRTRLNILSGWHITERQKVLLVLLAALIQGIIYLFLLPPWQHYDEPTHFEYAWLIAERGELPQKDALEDYTMRREVAASMLVHDFYWNLPKPDLLTDDRAIPIGISELGHPPAYYALVSLPLRLVHHLDMTTQLYVARSVSVLLWLFTIAIMLGIIRDLTPTRHPLRWAFPLVVVLLPPFASHMTAVNNDVGAVFILSLFLWGTVRMIRFGIGWRRLLWVMSTAILAVLTKNTAAVALLLLPLAVLIALWVQQKWRWRWFWLGVVGLFILALIAILAPGDAQYWYRDNSEAPQLSTTQVESSAVADGYAIRLEVTPEDTRRRLLNPILHENVVGLQGQQVTLGGWIWADKAVRMEVPALILSDQGSNRLNPVIGEPIEVSTTPTFFARTYDIPDTTGVAYYVLWGQSRTEDEEQTDTFNLYLDEAFVIVGELENQAAIATSNTPQLPPDIAAQNVVRNPSATQTWLRLQPWVHQTLETYIRRSPTYVFNAILDVQKNGPFLLGTIAPWLLTDFFAAFAWGHIRLDTGIWPSLFKLIVAIAFLGYAKSLFQRRSQSSLSLTPTLAFLTFVGFVVWLSALFWPLPYPWAKIQFPASRYIHVAIIPITLLLTGGWWTLLPRPTRKMGLGFLILCLLASNTASILLIWNYYRSIPS